MRSASESEDAFCCFLRFLFWSKFDCFSFFHFSNMPRGALPPPPLQLRKGRLVVELPKSGGDSPCRRRRSVAIAATVVLVFLFVSVAAIGVVVGFDLYRGPASPTLNETDLSPSLMNQIIALHARVVNPLKGKLKGTQEELTKVPGTVSHATTSAAPIFLLLRPPLPLLLPCLPLALLRPTIPISHNLDFGYLDLESTHTNHTNKNRALRRRRRRLRSLSPPTFARALLREQWW